MDGLTLCKQVKSKYKQGHAPIIVYSSLINKQISAKCNCTSDHTVAKPNIDEVIDTIDELNQ